MVIARQPNQFIILGPEMASGKNVLEAIHSLYFLPENFKLILTGRQNADQSFFKKVKALVDHDDLGHRVEFVEETPETDIVILPNTGKSRTRNSVAGDSAEALASAILEFARARR